MSLFPNTEYYMCSLIIQVKHYHQLYMGSARVQQIHTVQMEIMWFSSKCVTLLKHVTLTRMWHSCNYVTLANMWHICDYETLLQIHDTRKYVTLLHIWHLQICDIQIHDTCEYVTLFQTCHICAISQDF